VLSRTNHAPPTGRAPMRLIAYIRLSREEQTREQHGLAAQTAAITSAATAHGWEIVSDEADVGLSGKSMKRRTGLAAALGAVEAGAADGIVVSRLDRLSRSVLDCRAEADGWNLVVLDLGLDLSTPQGRFTAHVLCAMAELERELIGARTREALAVARAKGVRLGRPPEVSPALAARICDMADNGRESFAAIARRLTAEGVATPRGAVTWSGSTVAGIVRADRRQRGAVA